MLLRNLGLLIHDPAVFFYLVGVIAVALLTGITIHEFGHALVADRLGDPTPRRLGRVSLNPIRHLDPMGTLMVLLVGFGWGKPVPVSYEYLGREPRRAMALVASAGALFNLTLAAVFGAFIRGGVVAWHPSGYAGMEGWSLGSVAADLVGYIILLNIVLAVFNLIPVAPLDGFKIVVGLLPRREAEVVARTERYGPLILLAIVVLGIFTGYLWDILMWPVDGFVRLFVGQAY